ncbi:MAG: secondary metabolism, biosynthesis of secondary products derived from primary amino acid [Chthoniobacter sp.]|nr:secondary metabolism, biosynthesis of secondary products derived from primary amino acid [Chthoniobacter sp.]
MVSGETGLPASFDLETGRNVQWIAQLGTETHGMPIIAGGRVFIGTNNGEPRDPTQTGDCGVLMCFDEKDGRFLWQHAWPKRAEDPYFDWPKTGMSSPVTVEGDRAYVVNNRGEVVCLDTRGAGEGIASKVHWTFDLSSGAGIWSHDGAHSSILIRGEHLYLNTGTGVDNSHRVIRTPDAPSLVVLDKASGRLLAREKEGIAPKIFHCTWSSPALGEVDGRPAIFFAAGDGIVRAFEPLESMPPEGTVATLRKVWQFDPDPTAPKEQVHRFTSNRQIGPSNIYGMPVLLGKRLFVAGGGDVFWGKNEAWLKCVDTSKPGDVTAAGPLWSYALDRHTLSTPAVHNGLVFVSDTSRNVHCVDAETGAAVWVHPTKGDYWASPLVADGKVYIGSRKGDFWIFAASREKKVLATVDFKRPISATPIAANGVLYVATMTQLYALREGVELNGAKP